MSRTYSIMHKDHTGAFRFTHLGTIAAVRDHVAQAFMATARRHTDNESDALDYAGIAAGMRSKSARECGLYACADMFNDYWEPHEFIHIAATRN